MSLAIRKPIEQSRLLTDAANEHHGDAGNAAIAAMREMLGKSSAASQFDKLSPQQRAMIFFGARLKPSEYINKPLQSLNTAERDALRLSLIALVDIGRAFSGVPLSRDQFLVSPKPALVKSEPQSQTSASAIDNELDEISAQVSNVIGELAELHNESVNQ